MRVSPKIHHLETKIRTFDLLLLLVCIDITFDDLPPHVWVMREFAFITLLAEPSLVIHAVYGLRIDTRRNLLNRLSQESCVRLGTLLYISLLLLPKLAFFLFCDLCGRLAADSSGLLDRRYDFLALAAFFLSASNKTDESKSGVSKAVAS